MVLVFKTSVDSDEKTRQLKPLLDELPAVVKWNFDLMDCDNILRIVGKENVSGTVITTLNKQGFECIELE